MTEKNRALLTSLLELVGMLLIVVAVFIAFGLAAALFVAGLLLIGASYLITHRGGRQ